MDFIPGSSLSWEGRMEARGAILSTEARGLSLSLSQSAGRAGLLELLVPLPHLKAGGPMSSLGLGEGCAGWAIGA